MKCRQYRDASKNRGAQSVSTAFTLLNAPTKATGPQPTAELSLPKLPFYRSLTSALRDISLADHVVLRLEAIPVWTKFWESALLFTYNQALSKAKEDTAPVPGSSLRRIQELENIVVSASSDLLDKRLQESRLPSLSVNILLSLAGKMLAGASSLFPISPSNRAFASCFFFGALCSPRSSLTCCRRVAAELRFSCS